MVLGLFTIIPVITAGALDGIGYIDENGEPQTANGVTAITSGSTSLNAGWYAVTADTEINNRITCTGDVHLILCDNAKLTDSKGIEINEGNSLTIYEQSAGTGELELSSANSNSPLGGEYYVENSGVITINGGKVTANATGGGAGIGGGRRSTDYGRYSTVSLSWTNDDDSITANSYSGTVTLGKHFISGSSRLNPGTVSDNGTIANKTLTPSDALEFTGHSISLNGDIGLNFFLGITEEAQMHFEWYNKTYDYTVTAADYDAASNLFRVQLNVAAAEMTCPITVTLTEGDLSVTETYSVRDYADVILDSESAFSQSYVASYGEEQYGLLNDLVKKMLDYGAKAQTRFGVTDFDLANEGVDYTMQQITANHIKTKMTDMTKDLDKAGLNYVGTSIVFLSQTTLRHYYVISDAGLFEQAKETANFTFVDKGQRICFEQKDIAAAQLDVAQIFRLGDTTYNYSVLDYCKLVLADENKPQAYRELAMATYWYNDAAKAYFYGSEEYEDDIV